jgi:hypothetical protein
MSRRTMLATGLAGVVVAGAAGVASGTGTLDDVLRGLGAKPHPEPDPGDKRRLRQAADAQAVIIATIDATVTTHGDLEDDLKPFRVIADEQLVAVGGRLASTDVAGVSSDRKEAAAKLSQLAFDSAEGRANDAVSAASPDVARVLASMSAGLSQLAVAIGAIR